jgi:hypothetical protein
MAAIYEICGAPTSAACKVAIEMLKAVRDQLLV